MLKVYNSSSSKVYNGRFMTTNPNLYVMVEPILFHKVASKDHVSELNYLFSTLCISVRLGLSKIGWRGGGLKPLPPFDKNYGL